MSYSRSELEAMVRKLRYDLTAMQSKVSDLLTAVSSLPLPETEADLPKCPVCGPLQSVRSERALAEHMENLHQ